MKDSSNTKNYKYNNDLRRVLKKLELMMVGTEKKRNVYS